MVGPVQPAHAEQRRVLAIDCLGVAASECEIYFDRPARRHLLEVFADMARAPVHGVPPDDGVVDQQEDQQEQTRATSSSGATAAAGAAKTLQALARPVTEKNKAIERAERIHRVHSSLWRGLPQ